MANGKWQIWHLPGGSPAPSEGLARGGPQATLKLYQPAHQRYYLVTACLVCGIVGLPDRALDSAHQERVSFVVRRLLPPQWRNVASSNSLLLG